ncbi:paraquat-inducible protein A [Agaribacter flavus]|uniref:Paraquat-inducible protein A n=1 Tax=Agaribacter flavus TaxID=1902781 RepID=A0ABV7FJM3_9ALTE
MNKKHLGFAINLVAIAVFIPGIFLSMFSLNMEMGVNLSGTSLSSELVSKDLSIIGTVKELWQQERWLVAFLIFAFSVLVPIIKTSLVSFVYFCKNQQLAKSTIKFVATIGKWSMADVFVVAVFLAVLSTNHADTAEQHQISFFGMKMAFELSTQTLSNVGEGFYYFVAYCLLSLIGTHFVFAGVNGVIREQITAE